MGFAIEREAKQLVEQTAAKYGAKVAKWSEVDGSKANIRAILVAGTKTAAQYVCVRGKGGADEVLREIEHETLQLCRRLGIVSETLQAHAADKRGAISMNAMHRNSDGPQTVAQARALADQVFGPTRGRVGALGEKLRETVAKALPPESLPPPAPVRAAPPPAAEQPAADFHVPYPVPVRKPKPESTMQNISNGHATAPDTQLPIAPPRGRGTGRATRAEIIKAMKMLDTHGVFVDGVYVYADGWSDDAIKNAVNPLLAPIAVAEIRREAFGPTQEEAAKRQKKLTGEAAIQALQAEVATLKDMVARLTARLDAAGIKVN